MLGGCRFSIGRAEAAWRMSCFLDSEQLRVIFVARSAASVALLWGVVLTLLGKTVPGRPMEVLFAKTKETLTPLSA